MKKIIFAVVFSALAAFQLANPKVAYAEMIPAESFHNIEFAFENGMLQTGMDFGLEYGYQWGLGNHFSIYPYTRLNFVGFIPFSEAMERVSWVNDWAGEQTVAVNIALVGIPYLVAGTVAFFESGFLLDIGFDFAYHPVVTKNFDCSLAVGIENSPLKQWKVNYTEGDTIIPMWVYPFAKAKAEVNGKFKAFMVSAWAEYQWDLMLRLGKNDDMKRCDDFNLGVAVSIILDRK